jgi:beta-lactamase superfamily II metal-dependent hydrolase
MGIGKGYFVFVFPEATMGKLYFLNVGFGDASIIINDSAVFLIDCHKIEDFCSLLPCHKKIRGVFITHQHRDHFSGLHYLKDRSYTIDYLICSPYQRMIHDHSVEYNEWNEFQSLLDYFNQNGSKVYFPYRQENFNKPYWSTNGVKFYIIAPEKSIASSSTREIHDASLVVKAILGSRNCLFAGDGSVKSLESIATTTYNYCNDILHASRHGGINGAQLDFIKKCNAQYTIISTQSGIHENVPHPEAMQRYRNFTLDTVYRTDFSGTIEFKF